MPELPEVETIRRGLAVLIEQPIKQVKVSQPKVVRPRQFARLLNHRRITNIGRRGKLLILHLDNGRFLLVHLRMTGQLVYRPPRGKLVVGGHPIKNLTTLPNKFTHVEISFKNGGVIYYNDVRRFGYLHIVDGRELAKVLDRFGPELLDQSITSYSWLELLKDHKNWPIKKFLLDQTVIAGVGNIYADEACFRSQLKPTRKIRTINLSQRKLLLTSLRQVLRSSIRHGGTSFNSYVDVEGNSGRFYHLRKVYDREGQLCSRCKKAEIKKIKFQGRGTHFCPNCQK